MESEGGASEPGRVVQDCLQICGNVLRDSETCQRLFFEMGGGWHFKLLDFFSPEVLERPALKTLNRPRGEDEDDDSASAAAEVAPTLWFEQPVQLNCAILAVNALLASFGPSLSASKGRLAVVSSCAEELLAACAHWLVRGGPRDLLPPCFSLLVQMAISIDSLAGRMFDVLLKYDKTVCGVHTPAGFSAVPHLHFCWSASSASDKMMISLASLLADRYIYPCATWTAHDTGGADDSTQEEGGGSFAALHSIRVLNTMLRRDEVASGLVLQHILAPPPPDQFPDDDMDGSAQDSAGHLEFGSAVFSSLVKALRAIVESQGAFGPALTQHAEIAVRTSNILALIFIHGGVLASELATALSTAHLPDAASSSVTGSSCHQILPYLLSQVSRLVRLPGVGCTVASALLRLLAGAASGCERASRQVTFALH